MIDFLLDEHELKKCEKLFQNIVFFCMLSCQNTVDTTVIFWFALRTGSENMKKTVVFAVHLKPLVEKTSQNTVFSTRSLKNTVNSDVFGRFSSLTLQNRRKYQCFFFYKHKNRAKYSVLGRFWPKIFDQEPQQQQQQQQEEEEEEQEEQEEEHMTPCKLGAGGPCRGAAWIAISKKETKSSPYLPTSVSLGHISTLSRAFWAHLMEGQNQPGPTPPSSSSLLPWPVFQSLSASIKPYRRKDEIHPSCAIFSVCVLLVGRFKFQLKHMSQKWEFSPDRGENKKIFETTT